jgi:NAD(P)-dependent dehydrogenase (short-subunit alcohol dehydrogenase family)
MVCMTAQSQDRPVGLVTGASKGFGRALARALAGRGWSLVLDARERDSLTAVADEVGATAVVGDVTDPAHREQLVAAVRTLGPLRLLVNNASRLGPSPQPMLADYPLAELARVYETDVFAPLALIQRLLPLLCRSGATIVNITSDAAAEAYAGWGGYGSAKSALDQVTAVLGVENPLLRVYCFDPGDMRTEMHQRAFPGEDISDRPDPSTVAPALLRLLDEQPASGRYRSADLARAHASSDSAGVVA